MRTATAAALCLLLFACGSDPKEKPAMAQVRYAGTVNAPDFPSNLQWLNTDHPLSLKDLRGKVVLLDFWTFCCINCIHVIPELKKLEAKYANELVVIGVHSAKFTTEKGTENIRAAILRYGLEHPVVNDKDFEVWNAYTVSAWPTFMIIDPDGKVVGRHSGEGVYELFDQVIGGIIKEFDAKGMINRNPLALRLEKDRAPESFLSFPGKIAASADGSALYVTDSNHHRIVVIRRSDGMVLDVIGTGSNGLRDGGFAEAQFNKPQGIAADGDALYVADTENHAIRKVDLRLRTVTTLAGTGKQAREPNGAGTGTAVDLNSPWDLLVHKGVLYIAMAGPHQVWTLDLATLRAQPYAGSGREDIVDGPLKEAALAQPSGITTDGTLLYVADSEVSGVRAVDLRPGGRVRTIVGEGLFDYGDVDGKGGAARLQHPIGIVYHDGALYVADTYNNKIKRIDPKSAEVQTFIGTGKTSMTDGKAAEAGLNEPNGLTFAGGSMYITDTNNHLIRVYDPATGLLSTLQLKGSDRLMRTAQGGTAASGGARKPFKGDLVQIPAQTVRTGSGTVRVNVHLPKGYKVNAIAPFYVAVFPDTASVMQVAAGKEEQNIENPAFPLSIPVQVGSGTGTVEVDLVIYYCEAEKENLCLIKQVKALVPVTAAADAPAGPVNVDVTVPAPVM